MAATVDFSSFFDSTLPNVYIKKVTISPGTEAGRRLGHSHDEETETNFEKDRFGKTVTRKNNTRNNASNKETRGLEIEVELVIKDTYAYNKKTTWFEDEELLDLLKIKVVLSKDQNITDRILDGRLTSSFLKRQNVRNKIQEQILPVRKMPSETLETFKVERVQNKNVYNVNYKIKFYINNYNPQHLAVFAHTFLNFNEAARKQEIMDVSQRKEIQGYAVSEIIIREGDVLKNSNVFLLPNGNVWAGPVHTTEQGGYMAGAFHTTDNHPRLTEKQTPNVLIQDLRILEEAKEAELLLQPYREKQIGKDTNIRDKSKDRKSISNSNSLRTIKKEVFITEPHITTNQNNKVGLLFHLDFENIIKKNSQYAAFIPTSDKKTQNEIYSNSTIKRMSIFRNRVVRGINRGETKDIEFEDSTQLIAASSEKSPGRFRRGVVYGPYVSNEEDSERIVIGAIKEVDINLNDSSNIRTFAVTDYDMQRRTDGIYSYRVEVEIQDYTYTFVRNRLRRITKAKEELLKFYQKANRRNNITGQEYTQNFISTERNKYQTPTEETLLNGPRRRRANTVQNSISSAPWIKSISEYCDALYNFTSLEEQKVINISMMLHKLCEPSVGNLSGIEILLELFDLMINKIVSITGNIDKNILATDFNSKTASFQTKQPKNTFKIEKRFKQNHDSNVPKFIGYDFIGGKKRRTIGPLQLTTEEFRARLDAENRKYFSKIPDDSNTQQQVGDKNSVDFSSRLRLMDNYFSYLTPAMVIFGDNSRLKLTDAGRSLWNPKKYNSFSNKVLAHKEDISRPEDKINKDIDPLAPTYDIKSPIDFGMGFDSNITDIDLEDYQNNIATSLILGGLNVSFFTPTEYSSLLTNISFFEDTDEDDFSSIDPKDILGENTKFATEPRKDKETSLLEIEETYIELENDLDQISNIFIKPIQDAQDGIFDKNKEKGISKLNPKNRDNIIDTYFSKIKEGDQKKKEYLDKLPNQIKSIIMSGKPNTNQDWFALSNSGTDLLSSPEYANILYYNFKHINRIEVLTGFEKNKEGELQINKPIYRLLTKEIFDMVAKSKRLAVCRMIPHTDNILNFSKSIKFKLPEFDTTFLIGPKQTKNKYDNSETLEEEDIINDVSENQRTRGTEQDINRRIADFNNLSDAGNRIMQELINSERKLDGIPVELTATVTITQPEAVTRVGTRFGVQQTSPQKVQQTGAERTLLQNQPSRRNMGKNKNKNIITKGKVSYGE